MYRTVLHLENFRSSQHIKIECPVMVQVDNIGEIFLDNNSILSQQTKHISVRHHFIREYIKEGVVKTIIFVKS